MILTLLRHGKTEASLRRLYCGSTDLPLCAEGIDELKTRWAGRELPAGALYTSGMCRADETLRLLYGERPYAVLSGLRETNFGTFEMRSYEELKADTAYQAWLSGDNEANVCPDGESAAQTLARAKAEIEALIRRDGDAVCICHGGPIVLLMRTWFGGQNRYAWTPAHGCGWRVSFDGGVPRSYRIIIPEQERKA